MRFACHLIARYLIYSRSRIRLKYPVKEKNEEEEEEEEGEWFTLSRWRNQVDEPLIYSKETHTHTHTRAYKNTHRRRARRRADSLLEWCFRVIKHSRTLAQIYSGLVSNRSLESKKNQRNSNPVTFTLHLVRKVTERTTQRHISQEGKKNFKYFNNISGSDS